MIWEHADCKKPYQNFAILYPRISIFNYFKYCGDIRLLTSSVCTFLTVFLIEFFIRNRKVICMSKFTILTHVHHQLMLVGHYGFQFHELHVAQIFLVEANN
jgi:hypothetical protein